MGNVRYPSFRKKGITKTELSRRIAKASMDVYLSLAIAILADGFGFGKKRIEKFREMYVTLAESLGTGMDDLDTIKKNIKEIYGVEI